MALKLDILANTRQFVSEAKKAGASTEDISDALDEMARDGDRAGIKLERSFRDIARASDKTANAVEQDFSTAGRKVGDSLDDGLGRVRSGAQEVTQEIGGNLGEAVSSVRGNLADLGQVGQDTLGGLAATIAGTGPAGIVGAAALAAGAVGLGLVTAELEKQQEQAEELRKRLSGAYQSAAEDGRAFLDTSQLIAEAYSLMFDPERAEEYKRIREDAKTLGLEESLVIDANTGSLEAQEQVLDRINGLIDDQNSKPRQQGIAGTAEWDKEMQSLEDIRSRWESSNEVAEQYAETARKAGEDSSRRHQEERDQIKRTRDADQDRWEAQQEAYERAKRKLQEPIYVTLIPDDAAVRNYVPPRKQAVIEYKAAQTAWQ